jgi:hypothetical protein
MGLSIEEQRNKIRKKESDEKKEIEDSKRKSKERIKNKSFQFGIAGTYFLFFKGKLVYIGESKCVMSRVSNHFKEKVKEFDDYNMKEFKGSDKQRKAYEKRLIKRFKPKYNIRHKVQRKPKIYYQAF